MLVQQERINTFYDQLGAFIQSATHPNSSSQGVQKHIDEDFVSKREFNPSVDFWIETIRNRMKIEYCRVSIYSPLYCYSGYSGNKFWFELAFDIAKGTNISWLNIIFPKLEMLIDPVSFKPVLDTSPIAVYVADVLPHQLNEYDWLFNEQAKSAGDHTPRGTTILNRQFKYDSTAEEILKLKKNQINMDEQRMNSYFFIRATQKLYFIGVNYQASEVLIDESMRSDFVKGLINLLGLTLNPVLRYKTAEDVRIEFEEARRNLVSSVDFNRLIVVNGGYPRLDLTRYYTNDAQTKLYPIKSFFLSRHEVSATYHPEIKRYPSKLTQVMSGEVIEPTSPTLYRKLGGNLQIAKPKLRNNINYTSSDDFTTMYLSPLSLYEFLMIRRKVHYGYYFDGNNSYFSSRKYLTAVIEDKFKSEGHNFSQRALPSLLKLIEYFYDELKDKRDPIDFRRALNLWSKNALKSLVDKVIDTFEIDLKKLIPSSLWDSIRKSRKWLNLDKVKWCREDIYDLYRLYGQEITVLSYRNDGSHDSYLLFNLFMAIFIEDSLDLVKNDIDGIAVWLTKTAPHLVSSHPALVSLYDKHKLGPSYKISDIIVAIERLFKTCSDINRPYIADVLSKVISRDKIDEQIIKLISDVYKRYDDEVKNGVFDHTRHQPKNRQAWGYLAKLLAGAGFFDSYLSLLCPTLLSFVDPVTKEPVSNFDLRSCVFSTTRSYLIILEHSFNLFELTGVFCDCSGEKLRLMMTNEVSQIKHAALTFQERFAGLTSQGITGEMLKLSTWYGLYKLVTKSVFKEGFLERKYNLQLETEPSNSDSKSGGTSTAMYNSAMCLYDSFMHNKETIYIRLVETGLHFTINRTKKSSMIVQGVIPYSNLGPNFRQPITQSLLDKYYLEIIYYLRENNIIPRIYPKQVREKIDSEYLTFDNFYNRLGKEQRLCLDTMYIVVDGEGKYFKDVYRLANLSYRDASKWYMSLLVSIHPDVKFTEETEIQYKQFLSDSRKSAYKIDFVVTTKGYEILFLSLMTYEFYTRKDFTYGALSCSYADRQNLIPEKFKHIFNEFKKERCLMRGEVEYRDIYNNVMFSHIYPAYEKSLSKAFPRLYTKKTCAWLVAVVDGTLFKSMPIHSLSWIFDLFESICQNSRRIDSIVLEDFSSMFDEVDINYFNQENKFGCNIKFICFLKSLNNDGFIEFLGAVPQSKRVRVLLSYVSAKGLMADENTVIASCLFLFTDELTDLHAKTGLPFFKPKEAWTLNDIITNLLMFGYEKVKVIDNTGTSSPISF
jgi:hypothetical protein